MDLWDVVVAPRAKEPIVGEALRDLEAKLRDRFITFAMEHMLRPSWWSSCECKPNLKRMRGRPRFSSLKRRRRNASSRFGQRPHMYSELRPDSGPSC